LPDGGSTGTKPSQASGCTDVHLGAGGATNFEADRRVARRMGVAARMPESCPTGVLGGPTATSCAGSVQHLVDQGVRQFPSDLGSGIPDQRRTCTTSPQAGENAGSCRVLVRRQRPRVRRFARTARRSWPATRGPGRDPRATPYRPGAPEENPAPPGNWRDLLDLKPSRSPVLMVAVLHFSQPDHRKTLWPRSLQGATRRPIAPGQLPGSSQHAEPRARQAPSRVRGRGRGVSAPTSAASTWRDHDEVARIYSAT